MEIVHKPLEFDGSSSFSKPDIFDFSFKVPQAAEEMYAADEIFLHGQLLPFNPSVQRPSTAKAKRAKLQTLSHRRAESLNSLDHRRREDAWAAEYERLRRAGSDTRAVVGAERRPRWLIFVLGAVRFPAEMEMKEIKTRQRRREAPAVSAAGHCWRRIRWGILHSLSCRAADSIAVVQQRYAA
ncbi:hypothetical protein HPP92_010512 [Vanilla planifolia]|uniref:Uncharacterized protein n=1 Tax=Vanilla planifolia TaxID=51239 RepID=A0A835R2I7_VANPL|nr:hypothetical protein HPP92_010749 [Vanilla planifolia]KAG0482428.1 hypothetical protein HPP92_010512 [Vanilla planifolia]